MGDKLSCMQVDRGCLPGGYQDVQPGDCVVAFSRNDIYDIKATIESTSGRRSGPASMTGLHVSTQVLSLCCQGQVPAAPA